VVRISFGDADTYDLFIASDSGEPLGERITKDQKTRFVRLSDRNSQYSVRHLPGRLIPRRRRMHITHTESLLSGAVT
jgi:hypothetical protein